MARSPFPGPVCTTGRLTSRSITPSPPPLKLVSPGSGRWLNRKGSDAPQFSSKPLVKLLAQPSCNPQVIGKSVPGTKKNTAVSEVAGHMGNPEEKVFDNRKYFILQGPDATGAVGYEEDRKVSIEFSNNEVIIDFGQRGFQQNEEWRPVCRRLKRESMAG
ncbi:hypothetical protein STEG23_036508 [Scotinomys teguina]